MHRKGVGFHGSPFVVTIAAQRLVGLFLVRSRERENVGHGLITLTI